ncbi:NgoFVII family restriction endonuclease [Elizabethkingia sp. HX QKY]|uniref:restriction endonuclease PLD domain-containing protein n=1 Tax=Elizabethkingia TaxID=308865 RepID=UPI002A24DEFC|nr:restriction endonuclease PLD domain-containing protein [Elizabethkingia sp. HX QKY]MDX8571477.1 NgoFVII family restriction endonuclease [Elizabethkingia sp. HX QKY]
MDYKIINNLSGTNNHSIRLKELFEDSDTITITSPFLMTDFTDFFGEIDFSQHKKIHLITTLSPKSFDQIKKISSLVSFIEFPSVKEQKVDSQISINNKLHGKIYIFKKNDNYISAIISSANFTGSGLSRNHEWGIEISNQDEIKNLEATILGSIEYSNLSFDDIYRMHNATTDFLAKQPETEKRDIDLKLTDLLTSPNWTTQLSDNIKFWLKPIGVTENPVTEDRLFNSLEDKLNFSKLRPNGVKPNDILIAYGVGTSKILSIYRVTSFPKSATQEEIAQDSWMQRWPWHVKADNLTPEFGSTWPTHNLWINSLKNEFLAINPNEAITAVGGKTLGALNFGKDKLMLSPGFAKFMIDKVVTINDNL